MKKFLFVFTLIVFFCFGVQVFEIFNSNQPYNCTLAARGCCSRHGGVCGCSGGRTKCCDGTLSPTCQCFMGENKGLQL